MCKECNTSCAGCIIWNHTCMSLTSLLHLPDLTTQLFVSQLSFCSASNALTRQARDSADLLPSFTPSQLNPFPFAVPTIVTRARRFWAASMESHEVYLSILWGAERRVLTLFQQHCPEEQWANNRLFFSSAATRILVIVRIVRWQNGFHCRPNSK